MLSSSGTFACREARRPRTRRSARRRGDERDLGCRAPHAAGNGAEATTPAACERTDRACWPSCGSSDRTWPRTSRLASFAGQRVSQAKDGRSSAVAPAQVNAATQRRLAPPPWSRRGVRRECRSCRRRVRGGCVVSVSGGPPVPFCRACARWHGTGENMMTLSYLGVWGA